MGGTQKPFVQEKKNGHDALFHCYCWLSNEDDEKLGDTKWAGTHLSSAMKSTTPTTTAVANALMMILQMEFHAAQPASKKDAQTQNMKNCWPISVLFTFYSQADLWWPGLVAWADLAVVKDRK